MFLGRALSASEDLGAELMGQSRAGGAMEKGPSVGTVRRQVSAGFGVQSTLMSEGELL